MCGAWPGDLVTWPCLRLSMIYCCALRLWSQICVTRWSCWFPVPVALSCCGWQDASGPRDGYICTRWLRSTSPTQIWVWLLRNAGFEGLCCETELISVQSLSQPWPRWPDFWLFTSIIDCRAGLFPVSGWFEWPASGVVGFYDNEPSWSCSLWLCNCL